MKLISFDPGDSTGIVLYDSTERAYLGRCIYKDLDAVAALIETFQPETIICESFQLYPGKAKSMAWNKFYPCEVIGVIRLIAQRRNIPLVEQSPGIKPYSMLDDDCPKGNDHIKDAYRHLWYYMKKNKLK